MNHPVSMPVEFSDNELDFYKGVGNHCLVLARKVSTEKSYALLYPEFLASHARIEKTKARILSERSFLLRVLLQSSQSAPLKVEVEKEILAWVAGKWLKNFNVDTVGSEDKNSIGQASAKAIITNTVASDIVLDALLRGKTYQDATFCALHRLLSAEPEIDKAWSLYWSGVLANLCLGPYKKDLKPLNPKGRRKTSVVNSIITSIANPKQTGKSPWGQFSTHGQYIGYLKRWLYGKIMSAISDRVKGEKIHKEIEKIEREKERSGDNSQDPSASLRAEDVSKFLDKTLRRIAENFGKEAVTVFTLRGLGQSWSEIAVSVIEEHHIHQSPDHWRKKYSEMKKFIREARWGMDDPRLE